MFNANPWDTNFGTAAFIAVICLAWRSDTVCLVYASMQNFMHVPSDVKSTLVGVFWSTVDQVPQHNSIARSAMGMALLM